MLEAIVIEVAAAACFTICITTSYANLEPMGDAKASVDSGPDERAARSA
jgi:hypothetical protein